MFGMKISEAYSTKVFAVVDFSIAALSTLHHLAQEPQFGYHKHLPSLSVGHFCQLRKWRLSPLEGKPDFHGKTTLQDFHL